MANAAARKAIEEMLEDPQIGHTGDFSRGTIMDDDKGAMNSGIQGINGEVIQCFGKTPIRWHSMSPNEARTMAIMLIEQARRADDTREPE